MSRLPRTAVLAALVSLAPGSWAQDDPEKAEMRRQIEELKRQQQAMQQNFDRKIAELEKRLDTKKPEEAPHVKTEILTQIRYDFDSGANDSFYVRRIEMRFTGRVNPKVSWVVMIDPAKNLRQDALGNVDQSSRILQDAFVSLDLADHWSLDAGQKKTPFSYEAQQRSGELDALERALFLSQGKYGDVRDLGVWINARYPQFEVTGAVMNGLGESQNQKDANEQKAYGLRGVFKPKAVPGLHLGAAVVSEQAPTDFKRERVGFEAQYKKDEWTLRSELATALTDGKRGQGWYGHLGYKFKPDLEGVLRYDTLDPDRNASGDDVNDFIVGLNYFLQGHDAKIQLNYVNRRFGDSTRRTLWQVGLQTRW